MQHQSERAQDVQLLKLQQAKRDTIASQKPEPDAWRSPLSFLVFWWYLRRVLCLVRTCSHCLVLHRACGRMHPFADRWGS